MDSTSTVRTPQIDPDQKPPTNPMGHSLVDPGEVSPTAGTSGVHTIGVGDSRRVSEDATAALNQLYGPVNGPLKDVERRLSLELQSPYESLIPVLRHGTQLGGKRLRPAMLLLAGAAVGDLTEDHLALATVIEMVHTATLIHDDVLDDAETRRHVATINAQWDEHTSILLGDYLFAQSFRLAASLGSTETCCMIGEAARLVCEGELRQVLQREVLDIDEETYLEMIRGKTAELCRVSCQLGAKLSGGDAAVRDALGVYGNSLGIAFQIVDDYLDLWGDDNTIGKTLGTDIAQGKMTLPIIRLLDRASQNDRSRIVRILQGPPSERLERIRPLLDESDARQYTRGVAEGFKGQALEALEALAESDARTSLAAIAEFNIDRRF